jgi:hypothetical protein
MRQQLSRGLLPLLIPSRRRATPARRATSPADGGRRADEPRDRARAQRHSDSRESASRAFTASSRSARARSILARDQNKRSDVGFRFLLELSKIEANPSARAILPAADATRAVPTIGASAARTARTCSASMSISEAMPRFKR